MCMFLPVCAQMHHLRAGAHSNLKRVLVSLKRQLQVAAHSLV